MYCRSLRHACAFAADPLLIKSKVLSEASVVSSAARYTPEFRSVDVGHLCAGCSCNCVLYVLCKSKSLTTSRTRSGSVCSFDELHGDTWYALMHCGTLFIVQARDAVAHSQQSALLVRNAFFLWRQCLQNTRRFSKGRGEGNECERIASTVASVHLSSLREHSLLKV